MLDPAHAEHIAGEVEQARGLLQAVEALDAQASETPVSNAAHRAVVKALHRAFDDIHALIEGYTEPPDLRSAQSSHAPLVTGRGPSTL